MAVRIVLNSRGVEALLKSPQVRADLERRARKIAADAGPGHEVDVFVGRHRARATVRTATDDARAHPERLKAATKR